MGRGKLRVSGGFLVLAAWLLYRDAYGVVWQGLLACLLHETGNWIVLHLFGKYVKGICITVIGAQIVLDDTLSYSEEFLAAAAGPVTNLLLALLCCRLPNGQVFAGVNLSLVLFNLLPIGQLDGARMLRALLCAVGSDEIACCICDSLGYCFTVVFGLIGGYIALKGGNVTLFVMCIWLGRRIAGEKIWKISAKRMEKGLVRRSGNR